MEVVMHVGFPQGIVLALLSVGCLAHLKLHGTKTEIEFSVYQMLIRSGLWLALLYWGGFFR